MKNLVLCLALLAVPVSAQTLGVAPNSLRTVLTANVGLTDTTISVAVCSKITNGAIVNIDNELMLITALSVSCVPSVQRAYLGTAAARHYTGGIVASYLTDLTTNASNILAGTLAAARGGAGTINGVLKGNGSGVVSQALPNVDFLASAPGTTGQVLVSNGTGGLGSSVTLAPSATTDTTNAANISSGTISSARLPNPITASINATNVTATGGTVDLSGSVHTQPAVKGLAASIPLTCTLGEVYFATDASVGRNLYYCTSTNTWTQQISGGAGNPPGGSAGQIQYNNGGNFGGLTVSGDGTLPSNGVLSISKVNGTSVPSAPTADKVLLTSATSTGAWTSIPLCLDTAGQHLNYDTTAHAFSCGTTASVNNSVFMAAPTTTYSVLAANGPSQAIIANATGAAFTVTLFTAVGRSGYQVSIKKSDATANAITIATTASQTIDGATTQPITQQYNSLSLVSDGTNWLIL